MLHAQSLSGTITDVETHQPLEAVMISVIHGQTITDYSLTDIQGHYHLPWKYQGKVQLNVSLLGYRKVIRNIQHAGIINISLQPEAIMLKEVRILPGRINSRKDTVRYDLSRFASSNDVHIKDVLKKLPGVDIDENGQIKYKGKAIDHYFVEGMDITGGRYNQINNNLNAQAVKTAEIMENYQSVKALKNKINSDEVALNLKLNPEVRDQWIANGTLGTGWSNTKKQSDKNTETTSDNKNKLLWEGGLNALQLGKSKQSIYTYKSNNNGTDLSKEQNVLTMNDNQPEPTSSFLKQTDITAPLDKPRLLFNKSHTLNGNRMYRWNESQSLHLQAGYTHNQLRQQRENRRTYYQPEDTILINENYNYRLLSNTANVELQYEDNSTTHYLKNELSVEGELNRGTSLELQQTIHTSRFMAGNNFNLIKNKNAATWKFGSFLRYTNLPAWLLIADKKDHFSQQNFYTDNTAFYLHKGNNFTQQYKLGMQGEWSVGSYSEQTTSGTTSAPTGKAQSLNGSNAAGYLSTLFQMERNQWSANLSMQLKYQRFFDLQHSFLFFNPNFYLRYKLNYHWKFSIYGSLTRSAGELINLYPTRYRIDYRTWKDGNKLFPVSTHQTYNLYGEYKNTVNEFFITASLTYDQTHQNTLYEQNISQDTITYIQRKVPNNTKRWIFSNTLSKGVYDWHLKTSLSVLLNHTEGKQLSYRSNKGNDSSEQHSVQTYHSEYIKVEPKLIWSPTEAFEAEYHATLECISSKIGQNTQLTSLSNFTQRLQLTFGMGHINCQFTGEHYRNDLKRGTQLNTLFADASVIYRHKKWRLEIKFSNLFNKREYAYTTYSDTQSYTSRLNIRPRELRMKMNYQF